MFNVDLKILINIIFDLHKACNDKAFWSFEYRTTKCAKFNNIFYH